MIDDIEEHVIKKKPFYRLASLWITMLHIEMTRITTIDDNIDEDNY